MTAALLLWLQDAAASAPAAGDFAWLGELVAQYGLPLIVGAAALKVWLVLRAIETEARNWVKEANAEVVGKLSELRTSIDKMADAITERMLAETEHALRIDRLEVRANHAATKLEVLSRDVAELKGRVDGRD